MAELIVRKLDDAVKERLEARAARNGRTAEAEARAIIEDSVQDDASPSDRTANQSLAEFMSAAFKGIGLTDEEWQQFNIGVSAIGSDMRIPDFAADEYEETISDK